MTTPGHSAFQSGGGTMGAKVRAFDWAATPLGPLPRWSTVLRVTVDQMLASKFPACLFWGPDFIAIYNDAYRPILGAKPEALGRPMRETWSEAWEQLRPIAEKALAGESTFIENYPLEIDRKGRPEVAHFTFNYGPVFDADGTVVGMLDTVVETTAQVQAERRLRQEQQRQQELLQQMPGFVAVLAGPNHVYEYVNDAYVVISGPRRFIGRTVREVFPDIEGQGYYEMLDRVYTTGRPIKAEAIPIALAGETQRRHIDLLYAPIRDAAGQVQGIFVGGYDVSERVHAEAELRASEARLRALNADLERRVIERTLAVGRTWQLSPDLLAVFDAEGCFQALNPAWGKALGFDESEMMRSSFRGYVHPDDREATEAAWADASQRGQPVLRFENRYRSKAGGWRWLSWVAVPEDDKVYCIARDVTAEKAHAAALAERTAERDVLATIVQATASFIQVVDTDYRLLAVNRASVREFERVFGRRPAVGDSLVELLAHLPSQQQAALALWRRAMAGESFTTQAEFGDPQRGPRHYELTFEVLRAGDGRQIGAFLTSTDITDRVRQQRALAEAQEALRQAQKMEAVGQLTGGIAHDFNNLLAAISGALQVMKLKARRGEFDGFDRYLEMGERSVRSAASLTQRLLAFSRRQTLDPRPTDVNRLVHGLVDLISRTVGPAVEVVVDSTPDLWPTCVDASQLENALLNLCINARDAMPSGGRLTLATAHQVLDGRAAAASKLPPGDYVRLAVADTGTGMTPDVVQRAFDPFFTTKRIGHGTGLGLSMVYGFVRQSGGAVLVDSTPGAGTTMSLLLPRHDGAAVPDDRRAARESAARGAGETILLVDDEETVRQVVAEVLADTGYTVLTAADAAQALQVLQADTRIDLLVTDVGLPGGLDGRRLADAGRALRPRLEVLFITGYAATAEGGHPLGESGMAVLTKPFEIAELAARVRERLDRREG